MKSIIELAEIKKLKKDSNGSESINPNKLKEKLLETNSLKTWGDTFMLKNSEGFWSLYANSKELQRNIRKNFFNKDANNKISHDLLKSVLEDVLVHPDFSMDVSPEEETLLFQNGSVSLVNLKLQPKPENKAFYTYYIKANFDSSILPKEDESILDKIKSTRFSQLLSEMFPDDDSSQLHLLELLGYLLSPTVGLKKAVLFVGKPNTGKSLLVKVLRALLPDSVISNLDLSRIGRKNENASLLGAQINISEDFDSTASIDMSTLKLIIANEVVTVSQKYQASVPVPLRTKLLMIGNALPKVNSKEIEPFRERMFFLRFDNEAKEKDVKLIDQLKEELDLISTACIYAYSQALQNNFSVATHSHDWFMTQLIETQSEKEFVCDMLRADDNEKGLIRMKDLKAAYQIYCKVNGLTENSMADLRRCIYDTHKHVASFKKNLNSIDLGSIRCLKGVVWNMENLEELDSDLHTIAQTIDAYLSRKDSTNNEKI